jgi:hypothetical protein
MKAEEVKPDPAMEIVALTMLADRRFRISLRCLVVASACAVASLLGGYLSLYILPQGEGWNGLEGLVRVIVWTFAGLVLAACIGLISLGYGMACARERKRVLFWVVPLGLAAAFGLIAGLIQLTLWTDGKLGFIPGGKQDDVAALLGIVLGWASLFSLLHWITSQVYEKRFRMFPGWSIPLWAGALTGVMFLLG